MQRFGFGRAGKLAGGFLHEVQHVRQGLGLGHVISAWSTREGLTPLGRVIRGALYVINPVERSAFSAGLSNLYNLGVTAGVNTIVGVTAGNYRFNLGDRVRRALGL